VVAEYIVKIGTATENEAKFALVLFLLKRFEEEGTFNGLACPEGKEAVYLAAGTVMNVIFGEIDLEHSGSESWRRRVEKEKPFASESIPDLTVQFAGDNASQIENEARKLSSDDQLCLVLTGAAYNTCYARYIQAGGSRGIFSNLFITYIRTIYKFEDSDLGLKTFGKICELGSRILNPIDAMLNLGILRHFPSNPSEQNYYTAVHEFAVAMGKT
jgi:hypothetical protein